MFDLSLNFKAGVKEVVLAISYKPHVMIEALRAFEEEVEWFFSPLLSMWAFLFLLTHFIPPPFFKISLCLFPIIQHGIRVICSQETEPLGTGDCDTSQKRQLKSLLNVIK